MSDIQNSSDKELLGEILIKRKRITEEQLQEALKAQQNDNSLIGEILVKLGYLDEKDIVVALIMQCNLPYIAVNKYDIPQEVLGLIPEQTARELRVMPLDRVETVLSVVMENPLDQKTKERLEALTKCKVAAFVATRKEIDEAIARWYKKSK